MTELLGIDWMSAIIGHEVIGVDGCTPDYRGTVVKVTQINHRVLGPMTQIWVNWEREGEHLTPYSPKQFKRYTGNDPMGVYVP